ncbi:uncharacterized protein LOC143820115 [Paroedura picta]|uniref:uncharacterized protein LOC143820115 n=1 Tax=Paroedura picta TaxID=143630 RepID=UPI00405607F2
MQGFQNLILLTTSCILTHVLGDIRNDGDACLSKVRWRELWKGIDKLGSGNYSSDCIFTDRGHLCEPAKMIKTIVSDNAAVVQVLHKIAKLFKREENPLPNAREFLIDIHQEYDNLKTCLQPTINLSSHRARVTECFQYLYTFLNDHQNTPCAWQTPIIDSMVMLQELEQQAGYRPQPSVNEIS